MGVFDAFTADWREGDFTQMESTTIDLSSPEGLKQLERHIYAEAQSLYGHNSQGNAWERLAGRSLADVADDLARDLMQGFPWVRTPILKPLDASCGYCGNVIAYVYRHALEWMA